MKNPKKKLISLDAASHMTGYEPGELMIMNGCGKFPSSVTKRNGSLMFSLDEICEWNEINRKKLMPGYLVAYHLNVSYSELIALNTSCANFPRPVSTNKNIFFSEWITGDILDWCANYWRSV